MSFKFSDIKVIMFWYLGYFRSRNKFLGRYPTFQGAQGKTGVGYEDRELLNQIIDVNLAVKNGLIVQERDGVPLEKFENSISLNFHLLNFLQQSGADNIRIVDFGGGLGTSFRQFVNFTKFKPNWAIIEQQGLVEAGKEFFTDEYLTFHTGPKGLIADVLVFSAVIDFLEDPFDLVAQLISVLRPRLIVIDRSLFHEGNEDFYVVKKTAKHITGGKLYPVAFFSKQKMESFFHKLGYGISDTWNTQDGKVVNRLTVGHYLGFALEKINGSSSAYGEDPEDD